jgi:hypothetical protein
MEPTEAHEDNDTLYERGEALIRSSRALLADLDERLDAGGSGSSGDPTSRPVRLQ